MALVLITRFNCPDFGIIELVPHITGGAIAAFLDAGEDKEKAFFSVLEKLVRTEISIRKELSYSDLVSLAEFYFKYLNMEEIFNEKLKSSNLFDAFYETFIESQTYNNWTTSKKATEKRLSRIISLYQRPLYHYTNTLQNIFPYSQIQILSISFTNDLVKQIQISSPDIGIELVNRARELGSSLRSVSAHFRSFSEDYQELVKAFDFSNRNLLEYIGITNSISERIYESILLTESFEKIHKQIYVESQAIQSIGDSVAHSVEVVENFNNLLAESNLKIESVNDFFSRREIQRFPSQLPGELRKSKKDILVLNDDSEFLLFQEAGINVATTNHFTDEIVNRIVNGLSLRLKEELQPYKPFLDRAEILSKTPKFIEVLQEFAVEITKNCQGVFLIDRGNKWVKNPEKLAQSHLGIYLKGKFSGVAFVGKEIASGNGYVDLLVSFMSFKHIVELKMLGVNYYIGWAKSGFEQLDRYMNTCNIDKSYLVVFDGRKTDRGEKLEDVYELENGKVYVIVVRIY
ncbi:MAG: hypothetical protein HQ591_10700 [candidate division Zixibacteria bacterium]|nr:hypothetical protein [Candidatus Tariuqbacter arcticus]